jgi:hypothetical protein
VVASFTDANPNGSVGEYTAVITWGDGHTTTGTIMSNALGGFNVLGATTYAAPGTYLLSVQISDLGGSKVTSSHQITVASLNRCIQPGQTEEMGFWHTKQGQALLNSFNGGPNATALGNWLATSFANLFGSGAGTSNLAGKTNAQVAAFFQSLWSANRPRVEAQVLATALNVYASTLSLGGTAGQKYGFHPTATGLGASSFTVVRGGEALGIARGTTLNVYQILQAANDHAHNGLLLGSEQLWQALVVHVFGKINSD